MQSIDTSRSGMTILSDARSAPDERSGGRSGCQASFPKQTTAKIRCTADRAHSEADIESVPRPRRWGFHAGAVGGFWRTTTEFEPSLWRSAASRSHQELTG